MSGGEGGLAGRRGRKPGPPRHSPAAAADTGGPDLARWWPGQAWRSGRRRRGRRSFLSPAHAGSRRLLFPHIRAALLDTLAAATARYRRYVGSSMWCVADRWPPGLARGHGGLGRRPSCLSCLPVAQTAPPYPLPRPPCPDPEPPHLDQWCPGPTESAWPWCLATGPKLYRADRSAMGTRCWLPSLRFLPDAITA